MTRFLLDMPVSSLLLIVLHEHGHEGVHAHQIGQDRATDRELLEIARHEHRIVITADLDFPRLLALTSAEGPGLILFRGGNYLDNVTLRPNLSLRGAQRRSNPRNASWEIASLPLVARNDKCDIVKLLGRRNV